MTKVWCSCTDCINNDGQRCKQRELKFKWRHMQTVNEGPVDMWVCDKYALSDEAKQIEDQFKALMKGKL